MLILRFIFFSKEDILIGADLDWTNTSTSLFSLSSPREELPKSTIHPGYRDFSIVSMAPMPCSLRTRFCAFNSLNVSFSLLALNVGYSPFFSFKIIFALKIKDVFVFKNCYDNLTLTTRIMFKIKELNSIQTLNTFNVRRF